MLDHEYTALQRGRARDVCDKDNTYCMGAELLPLWTLGVLTAVQQRWCEAADVSNAGDWQTWQSMMMLTATAMQTAFWTARMGSARSVVVHALKSLWEEVCCQLVIASSVGYRQLSDHPVAVLRIMQGDWAHRMYTLAAECK